jgi:two-component system OmpR family response regulator/two-component system response regulator RstA
LIVYIRIAVLNVYHHILLVEDDQQLAQLVSDYLSKNGFSVHIESNGLAAVEYIKQNSPELVVLDIMLPGINGMDVCRQARTFYRGPVLMLTALDEDMDQMLGLEIGADDYVIKPVKPRLLLTRIRTLLRRTNPLSNLEKPAEPEHLKISPIERTVSSFNQEVSLTTAEFDLLLMLAKNAGKVVDREQIVRDLRGFEYDGLDRSVDRRISRLRKKLHDDSQDPKLNKTIRGKGYMLCIKHPCIE